jgi:predicted nucleotidyltransferase
VAEPWTVDVPRWDSETPVPAQGVLADRGVRYADKFWTRDGWVYKAVGDLHPEDGVLAVPDWAPVHDAPRRDYEQRDGFVKVRDHRWPDGTPVRRRLPFVDVPLYARRFELLRPADVSAGIVPERAARRVVERPRSARERLVADLILSLTEAAGTDLTQVGLNGSYACGLSDERSDVDLDVYGSRAVAATTRALRELLCDTGSGWHRRWPPDEQTNLFYVWRAGYPAAAPETMFAAFEAGRRNRFNVGYRGLRVSVSYHSRSRAERFPTAPVVHRSPGPATRVRGVFVEDGPPGHLDLPAVFRVRDVRADSGQWLWAATVISYSKAFGFCRDGDRVEFTACPVRADIGDVLVIPSYGPEWPVRPLVLPG